MQGIAVADVQSLSPHVIACQAWFAVAQASHHRVRLWHATKEIYQDLSDSTVHSDPIHLFPGHTPIKSPCCLVKSSIAAAAAAAASTFYIVNNNKG